MPARFKSPLEVTDPARGNHKKSKPTTVSLFARLKTFVGSLGDILGAFLFLGPGISLVIASCYNWDFELAWGGLLLMIFGGAVLFVYVAR